MSTSETPLRSAYADDPEFSELLGLFVDELPDRVACLEAAVSAGDLKAVKRVAHQLKGSGGGYGFPLITDVSREVEVLSTELMSSAESDLSSLRASVDALVSLCGRVSRD